MFNFKQIANNRTALKRTEKDILYIVVHDTSNTSFSANAEMHYQYFNGGYRGASADFFVDDTQILKTNDYFKYYSFHCGDGANKYGINNRNSIGIEICINSSGNYAKAVNNTITLVKNLIVSLDIPPQRVVRHYDASRKNCPGSMSSNSWQGWTNFKNSLGDTSPTTKPAIDYNDNTKLQKDLVELGYVLVVDGIIGPKTADCIKDFQMVMGLDVDGIVGKQTKAKLNDVIQNEKLTIIYRSVNILGHTKKQGQDYLIIDRAGWIKKATTDIGVYWFVRKVADYVS